MKEKKKQTNKQTKKLTEPNLTKKILKITQEIFYILGLNYQSRTDKIPQKATCLMSYINL